MSDDRSPCRVCGRKFNPESLARHERVCAKQLQKKPRKTFDSVRQRVGGSDIPYNKSSKPSAPYEVRGNETKLPMRGGHNAAVGSRKPDWRKQHEDFIAAVRAAKAYGMAVKTGGPLPPPAPPSEHPDYVQCPTCGRRFNETAASRHMPFCAEQSNRVASRKIPDANAKMRANARNYVPPPPAANKPKSTSGGGGRMGMAGGGDYGYENYSAQQTRYGAPPPPPQAARRSGGPSGGNGSGGAAGRYAGANRQIVDDADYDYAVTVPAQGPRGSRLGGGVSSKTQPGVSSGARLAPISGGPGRGGSLGGSSAFGNRTHGQQGQQAVYMGSHSNGGRGGRYAAGMNGGYADYEPMPVGGGKPVASGGGMGRPAGSEPAQFCYECGNQYPSKTAKFCVECGVKRI